MRLSAVLLGTSALAAAATLAVAVTPDSAPLRVGVIVDCVGFFRGYEDLMLAGAELPFLERGGHLRTADPADGVTDARLPGGRRARLLIACDEGGEFTTVIAAARRLVEEEHVDVVVGGTWPGDGIVLGQVARRYPRVAFVAAMTGPVEVTLLRPSPNLFRVRPSYAQQAAGLGFYAYRHLGWRRAALLVEDDEEGWDESAAFTAEFCAVGGTVERHLGFPLALTAAAARRLAAQVDGIAVFSAGVTDPAVLLPTLLDPFGERRLIVGLGISSDQRSARLLRGVVSPVIAPPPGPRFAQRLGAAFPGLPTSAAPSGFSVEFDTSVEAVLEAAAAHADLRTSLARLELSVPGGSLRIAGDGQAIVPQTLVLHTAGGQHAVARLAAVPPLLGGLLFRSKQPSRAAPQCRRAAVPAYARSLVNRR
jgi:ABC-type branched-subunit amino acid transport system substrate-binding protein